MDWMVELAFSLRYIVLFIHYYDGCALISWFNNDVLVLGRASGMFFIAESKVFSSHSKKGLLDGGIQVDFILKLGSRVALFRP